MKQVDLSKLQNNQCYLRYHHRVGNNNKKAELFKVVTKCTHNNTDIGYHIIPYTSYNMIYNRMKIEIGNNITSYMSTLFRYNTINVFEYFFELNNDEITQLIMDSI